MKSIIILVFVYMSILEASSNLLTKTEAYALLKSQGFKWKLTETMPLDAEAKTEEANSDFNPRLQLGLRQYIARINPVQFGGANSETIDTVGFGTTAVELSWALIDPVSKAKLLSAKANEKMTAAQTKHFQNELTALMLLQYLNVQRLGQQVAVLDANIEKSHLILKLVSARKTVGAGIPLDVSRAKNLVQLDQLKKIAIFTKYTKARHELAITLGIEKLVKDPTPLKANFFEVLNIEKFLSQTIEHRHDLKAAETALEAANGAEEESRKLLFPKLNLLAEVGTTQATLIGLPPKNMNGFVGISFSVPLETGGLIQAKRKEAALLQVKASLQIKQTRAEIISQAREALEQVMAANEAVKASGDYLKTAEDEEKYAEQKYKAGSSNILDLTSAHTNLATARDTRTENIFNYEAAKVNYFRTIGDFSDYFSTEKGE